VRSAVLPSVNVPMAVNCRFSPLARLESAGITARLTSAGPLTVNDVDPTTDPSVAEIVAVPTPTA